MFSGSHHQQSVVRALQVHAREGMPGIELVESHGRLLLRPGGGRVRLAFLSEHIAFVKASPLTPGPRRPLLLRRPAPQVR